jgi:hypothetical protein
MENNDAYLRAKIPTLTIERDDDAFRYGIEFPRFVADGDDRDDLLRDGISTSSPTGMPRTKMMAKPALFRTFRTSPTQASAFSGGKIS